MNSDNGLSARSLTKTHPIPRLPSPNKPSVTIRIRPKGDVGGCMPVNRCLGTNVIRLARSDF